MQLEATLRLGKAARSLRVGDVSQSSRAKPIAWRDILGRRVMFFDDGTHQMSGDHTLSDAELFHSELLRFVHASLIKGEPQGHPDFLWVDASQNPVQVKICGLEAGEYMRQVHTAIDVGLVSGEMILDQDGRTVECLKASGIAAGDVGI